MAIPTHPGKTFHDYITNRDMSIRVLAHASGVAYQRLSDFAEEKLLLELDELISLSRVLSTAIHHWVNLQNVYKQYV